MIFHHRQPKFWELRMADGSFKFVSMKPYSGLLSDVFWCADGTKDSVRNPKDFQVEDVVPVRKGKPETKKADRPRPELIKPGFSLHLKKGSVDHYTPAINQVKELKPEDVPDRFLKKIGERRAA